MVCALRLTGVVRKKQPLALRALSNHPAETQAGSKHCVRAGVGERGSYHPILYGYVWLKHEGSYIACGLESRFGFVRFDSHMREG